MAAVSLFRNTTMADVMSCENVLLHYGERESRRYLFLFRKRSLPFANGSDRLQKGQLCRPFLTNRPLALRSRVTNTSFKQWVGILLMPKIDRAHKNYLTPEIWEGTHLRKIFNMAAKTTFCLYLVKRLIVTLRCAVNVTTSSFQHFPWSLSAKFVFRKR